MAATEHPDHSEIRPFPVPVIEGTAEQNRRLAVLLAALKLPAPAEIAG
jgi:hypothetical protein